MSANDNFDIILRRHDEIGARLTEGVAGGEYAALSRERAELDPIVGAIKAWRAKDKERADLAALLDEPALDAEMRAMAEAELERAGQRLARELVERLLRRRVESAVNN